MGKHLILYDGNCGLCDWSVQKILDIDHAEIFDFAPLNGITAKTFLSKFSRSIRENETVVLIENYKTNPTSHVYSKAPLRCLWLVGGFWKLIGIFSFLPSFLFDWIYQIIARNRYKIFSRSCVVPSKYQSRRFYP